jgi:hypothetical protein
MKSPEKSTYTKSYHSQPPRATGGTFFPAEDPPDLWWWSPAAGASGGGGWVCGLGSVVGGGVAGRRVVGGGGGVCCFGEGRRASSGLLSGCWRCDGGGGARLYLSTSAVFWRLGAGSPTKEPSRRWSLRDLDPSAWLLRAGAAPCVSSSFRAGAAPALSLWRCSGTGTLSFPFPAGAGPPRLGPSRRPSRPGRHPHCPCGGAPAPCPFPSRRGPDLPGLAPRDLGWHAASGWGRHWGCESRDWGRLPAAGPPGHPRRGSALTPGLTTAAPGPRTGP